ncbi:hypothetical protein AcV5_006127 [Taiwanofungus camphoratus]|nr:hypothetical protein AcV5_006127 [Antrodia cinnamomea]
MTMAVWDSIRMKSQLRLTAQRLGQLQDKMESQAQITRRDVATLLRQGNVALARAKVQKLCNEDILSDLLQTLEMHVGVIIGHLAEFEKSEPPNPVMIEAAASIIVAAPQVESKDLRLVREFLVQRLGPDYVESINDYVSVRVRRALLAPPPSATRLDQYLFDIAKSHGVRWMPDLQPHEKVNAVSEMLDLSTAPVVDISRLHMLCAHGLPDYPSWLRPRVWRLLLGTLPVEKSSWTSQARKNRDNYYDLVRRLLDPLSSLPPPTSPLTSSDASLMNASMELSQVPPRLLIRLQEEPETSSLCPLDETAPEPVKIDCARNLDNRLRLIRESGSQAAVISESMPGIRLESTPEIRLENSLEATPKEDSSNQLDVSPLGTPAISLSAPESPSLSHSGISTTLLPSRAMGAHHKHTTALLRLLYVHSCSNPANQSPHIGSLLVPIYSALLEEVEPEDAAHVEADAFWLFEAMLGEFTELNDEEGSNVWTRKFSERLSWADPELADDLQVKGLDPILPHYSYRWLIALLTHTFPLPSVLTVWDALFSRPMRERGRNAKLEYLVDICTSMLLRAKGVLLRLGRPGRNIPNLWSDETAVIPSSPLGARELDDAFAEGMFLLQQYPLEAVGGVDAILQTAYDLALRREAEANYTKLTSAGLGARLRDTVWKGLVNQAPILESHLEGEESDNSDSEDGESENVRSDTKSSTLTARLADTVWRGISNQSAMEPPPSPRSPLSPTPESTPVALPEAPSEETSKEAAQHRGRSVLFGYAEKLRESDAAATLAKVSTNWRVKAWDVWNKRASSSSSSHPAPISSRTSSVEVDTKRRISLPSNSSLTANNERRGSLPSTDRHDTYSPPERPAFFRPPRDSVLFSNMTSVVSPTSAESSPVPDSGSTGSAGARTSLASFSKSEQAMSRGKSGPRPLLLNSASLITSGHSRSPTNPPSSGSYDKAWADSVRGKRPSPVNRDSLSSMSSISPSDPWRRSHRGGTRSELDSDTTSSRIVPLRNSPSPMARTSRRATPTSSTTSSPPKVHRRMSTDTSTQQGSDDGQSGKGWGRVDMPDSPTTGPSPPPQTPEASSVMNTGVRVKATESHRGSMVISDSNDLMSDKSVPEVKLSRKTHTLPRLSVGDTSDSSATQAPSRSPRLKSKRIPPRLANVRTRDNTKVISIENSTSDQHSLAPERSDDVDNITTPRAMNFEASTFPSTSPVSPRSSRRTRKTSGEGNGEARTRKVSNEGREARLRKVSSDGHSVRSRKFSGDRQEAKHKRDSAAVEGDDEGYNDLLSAYESEDNAI